MAVLRVTLRALQPLVFPDLPGVILRGAVGWQFRRLFCVRPGAHCRYCMLAPCCTYTTLFEPADANGGHVPPPFVIRAAGPATVPRDEWFTFELRLFDKAIFGTGAWLYALIQAGNEGLHGAANAPTAGRGRFLVEQVEELTVDGPQTIWLGRTGELPARVTGRSAYEIAVHAPCSRRLGLVFASPFETRYKRQPCRIFQPAALANAAKRRLEALLGSVLTADSAWTAWMDRVWPEVRQLIVAEDQTAYYISCNSSTAPLHRSKAGRKQHDSALGAGPEVFYDGLIGKVILDNAGPDVCALLALAEAFHVGQNAAIGKGHLVLLPEAESESCATR